VQAHPYDVAHAAGTPTNATIYAQPYLEMEILALAKAYQDAAKWHLVKPRTGSSWVRTHTFNFQNSQLPRLLVSATSR
jgi:hypothetical protein